MREIFASVRVFDGDRVLDGLCDVVTEDGVITAVGPAAAAGSPAAGGATVTGGRGGWLLPGLIDAHVHLRGTGDVRELARWGVTTALDMGSWPAALISELRQARPTCAAPARARSGPAACRRRFPAARPTAWC